MVLFLGSTTGFLIPITWGGVQYAWDSWRTLVPLLVSGAGLVAFVLHQEFIATEPLVRTSVFKTRTAAVTYIGTVVHGIILWSILYYLPLYYEAVKGLSPIMAGVALFPQTFTVAPAAAVSLPYQFQRNLLTLEGCRHCYRKDGQIPMGDMGRMVPLHLRQRSPHLPQGRHQHRCMDLPEPRRRHRHWHALPGNGHHHASGSPEQRRGVRLDRLLLPPCFWPDARRRHRWSHLVSMCAAKYRETC
jgi:hypothetical protein